MLTSFGTGSVLNNNPHIDHFIWHKRKETYSDMNKLIKKLHKEKLGSINNPQLQREIHREERSDEDEAYILLFSNTKLRIVDITDPTNLLQTITSCPWTTAMIGSLVVTQSGDTMFITHPDMPMQELTRTSATNFARSAYEFDTSSGMKVQPYN